MTSRVVLPLFAGDGVSPLGNHGVAECPAVRWRHEFVDKFWRRCNGWPQFATLDWTPLSNEADNPIEILRKSQVKQQLVCISTFSKTQAFRWCKFQITTRTIYQRRVQRHCHNSSLFSLILAANFAVKICLILDLLSWDTREKLRILFYYTAMNE